MFPNVRVYPVYWSALGLLILLGDYASGPTIQFPILYLIPVSLAAWYNGFRWGLVFAITMPLIRLYYSLIFWALPLTLFEISINSLVRIFVLGGAAFLVNRTATQTRELARRVNVLEGFLPICSFCKKIRDTQGVWQPLERYISDRSNAQFTHGFCPECGERHYGEVLNKDDGSGEVPESSGTRVEEGEAT